MTRDRNLERQRQIANRVKNSNNGPGPGLDANQAAAQQAILALAELTALAATVSVKNINLGELAGCWGVGQLANNDGLWSLAEVSDWIAFENHLARAAAALYCAADLRGMKLHQLIMARVQLDAEIRERG